MASALRIWPRLTLLLRLSEKSMYVFDSIVCAVRSRVCVTRDIRLSVCTVD